MIPNPYGKMWAKTLPGTELLDRDIYLLGVFGEIGPEVMKNI
jgi:hypothetical protein